MKNRLRIVLGAGLIILFQLWVNAQSDQQQQYLHKIGVADSLYSNILLEYREIYIQLPASYSLAKDQKYPVVYILDGEVFLPAVSNVHDFYSGGFMPEMVLIGISNSKHRTRDLTTSHIKTKYGRPFNENNGEAANFSRFIAQELIPFIENKYPVSNYRTLIGHSYGGLFAIYTLINNSQLFSNYLAIDPSLDWDDQQLLKEAKVHFATKNYEDKSLYVSLSGQLHMQNSTVTLDNVMEDKTDFTLFARSNIAFSEVMKQNTENGLSFSWKFFPGDLHGTIAMPSIMDGLITLFEWFQMENTEKFNSFETSKNELSSIIAYRAKKLQNHFKYPVSPYPEDLITTLGYMSMDMGQSDKAKMFFEFAIEFYPNSANAYASMSNYYERMSDYGNALKFVTRAYEISGDEYFKPIIEALKEKK